MKSRKRGMTSIPVESVAGKSRRTTRAAAEDSEAAPPASPPRRRVRTSIQRELEAMKKSPRRPSKQEEDPPAAKKRHTKPSKKMEIREEDTSRPRRSRTTKESYLKRHFLEPETKTTSSTSTGRKRSAAGGKKSGSVDTGRKSAGSSAPSSVEGSSSKSTKTTGLRAELDRIVESLSGKVQVECAADGSKGALRNMSKKDLGVFQKKVSGSSFVVKKQDHFKDGYALFFEVKGQKSGGNKKSSRQLQLEEDIQEEKEEEEMLERPREEEASAEEEQQHSGNLDESLEEPLEELDEGDDLLEAPLDDSLGQDVGREEEVVEEGPVLSPLPVAESEEDGPLSSSPDRHHHHQREYPPSMTAVVHQHGYDVDDELVSAQQLAAVSGDSLERILYGQSPPQIEHSDDDEQDLKEQAEREAREAAALAAEESEMDPRYRGSMAPGAFNYLRRPKRRWFRTDRPVWQNPRWVSAAVKDPSLIDEALNEGMTPPQEVLNYIENVRCAQKVGGPSVYDVPRSRRKQNFTVPASLRTSADTSLRANLVTKLFRPSKTPNILRKSRAAQREQAAQEEVGVGEEGEIKVDSKVTPPPLLTSSGPHGLQFTTLPTPVAASIQAQLPAGTAGALDQAGVTSSAATVTSVAAAGGTGAPKSALEKLQQQRERERLAQEPPVSAVSPPTSAAAVEEDTGSQMPLLAQQESLVGVSAVGLAERDLPILLRPLRMTVQARGVAYSLLVTPAKEAQVQAAGAGPHEIVFAVLQLSGQPCSTDVLHDLLASVRQFLQDKVERLKQQAPQPPHTQQQQQQQHQQPAQLPSLSILDQEAIRSQTRAQAGASARPSLSVVLERPGAAPSGRRIVLQKPTGVNQQPRVPVLPIPGLLAGVGGQPRKILKILKPVNPPLKTVMVRLANPSGNVPAVQQQQQQQQITRLEGGETDK